MKPGHELDERVATEIFGAVGIEVGLRGPYFVDGEGRNHALKDYSTDIAAAWEVVEKFRQEGLVTLTAFGGSGDADRDGWRCEFFGYPFADGLTAPHAICLAALKAVGAL